MTADEHTKAVCQGPDGPADAAGWQVLHGNPTPAEIEALAAALDLLAARALRRARAGGPRRAEWSAAPYAAAGSWAR